MPDEITIDKNALFELLYSHSRLAQAEYERNPAYNNTHFSYKAEERIMQELNKQGVLNEFLGHAKEKEE